MGTRGAYGFVKNNVEKITYSHYDSYFEGLGKKIVKFVKETSIENLNKIFDKIELVNLSTEPTDEQIEQCKRYADLKVSNQSYKDWYCLLRKTQGILDFYKDDLKYMIDNKTFMGNSLDCEYAYIINLDTNKLEFYKGFQQKPVNNRWSKYEDKGNGGFYAVKEVASFDLDKIPQNWLKIVSKYDKVDDE